MATPTTVRKLALKLPDVHEATSYGTPAFFVKRKLFARMLDDADSVVIKIDFDDRARRIQLDPDTYYITDHYENYPMMIVRLSRVRSADLQELLKSAWEYARS